MINFLKGTVLDYKDQIVTLDVHDVGFQVTTIENTVFSKGEQLALFIYLQWHQENGPVLFGFQTELEKTVFLLIISCSGIGPKIGLAILSAMKPSSFLKVVQLGDEKALSAVNGIGAKKAEQMIVQLRHKVAKLLESGVVVEKDVQFEQWHNISEVLTSLNYSRNEITNALQYIKESSAMQAPFDQLLRKALSFLSKRV
jgi:holliday junction DNA helicase RuvA